MTYPSNVDAMLFVYKVWHGRVEENNLFEVGEDRKLKNEKRKLEDW